MPFRIYYLFQGPTRITRYKEDRILGVLFWLSPSVSGIVTLLHMAENFVFYSENPLLFNYSYCAKTPLRNEIMQDLAIINLGCRGVLCEFIGLYSS